MPSKFILKWVKLDIKVIYTSYWGMGIIFENLVLKINFIVVYGCQLRVKTDYHNIFVSFKI